MATMIGAGVVPSTAVQRRRRVYDFLDSAYPDRGRALRWCEQALDMYNADGDMKEARLLLRGALRCGVADYVSVYRSWIAMEVDHEGDVDAARSLFEEWARRLVVSGGLQGNAEFWCRLVAFEVAHGGGGAARAVAEAAVAACPRDRVVYAKYAKAELRLGHGVRASAVLARALHAFAEDADAKNWLVEEVRGYRDSMRWRSLGGSLGRLCRGVRRPRQLPGYERLCALLGSLAV